MVIYDKNQFTFNLLFFLILVASIIINIIYGMNFLKLNQRLMDVNTTLGKIESNQDFNFIQGVHGTVEHYMTAQGFYVVANDFGTFYGPSMQPSIFDGNTLIEKKYDGKSALEEGQIIRFIRDDGNAVIHRIRADYGDTVYVQGDSLKVGEIIEKARITHVVVGILFT